VASFDICQSKKKKALELGAKEVSMMELGRILLKRPGHPLYEKYGAAAKN
jgi:hypothetical protein